MVDSGDTGSASSGLLLDDVIKTTLVRSLGDTLARNRRCCLRSTVGRVGRAFAS
jgi:hypothetical protein